MLFRSNYNSSMDPGEKDEETTVVLPMGRAKSLTLTFPPRKHVRDGKCQTERPSCTFKAVFKVEPNPEVAAGFAFLAQGRLPERSPDLPDIAAGDCWYLKADGTLNMNCVLPLHILPHNMRDFITQTRRTIRAAVDDTIRLVRWRYHIPGGHLPARGLDLAGHWTLDGENWFPVPTETTLRISGMSRRSLSRRRLAVVADLYLSGVREPVAHEMIREAANLERSNPRSALSMGVAALEVGVKSFVADAVPDVTWLIENLPSPAIERILRDFVPRLETERSESLVFPPGMLTGVRRAVEMRNALVHGGAMPRRAEAVVDALDLIKDILWILDWHRGFDWAASNVRAETLETMGIRVPG